MRFCDRMCKFSTLWNLRKPSVSVKSFLSSKHACNVTFLLVHTGDWRKLRKEKEEKITLPSTWQAVVQDEPGPVNLNYMTCGVTFPRVGVGCLSFWPAIDRRYLDWHTRCSIWLWCCPYQHHSLPRVLSSATRMVFWANDGTSCTSWPWIWTQLNCSF